MKKHLGISAISLAAALFAPGAMAPVYAQAEQVLEGDAWRFANEGYAAYDAKDYKTAASRAREAIELSPRNTRLRLLLIYALQKQGALRAADQAGADALRAGVEAGPINKARANLKPRVAASSSAKPVTAAYRRGFPIATQAYAAYNKNQYEDAARGAEKAFRTDPSQAAWGLLWIDALEAQGKLTEATQAVDQLLAAGASNRDDLIARREVLRRRMAIPYAEAAFKALIDSRMEDALAPAQQAVALAPDSPTHRLLLISVQELNGLLPEAEQTATIAIEQDGENIVARVMRGYLRQRQGKADAAQDDFDAVLAFDWLDEDQRRNVQLIAADAALAAGRPDQALARIANLPADDKGAIARRDKAGKRRSLPDALTAANYPPPVQDCRDTPYGTVCDLLPSDASGGGPATQAYLAYGRQDYANAIVFARQAVEQDPDNQTYQTLLTTTLTTGTPAQTREAAERLETALAAKPGNADLLMQRGYVRQRLRQPALALQDFQAARATGEAPPTVVLDEAYAQSAAGDKRAAVNTLRGAIDMADRGELKMDADQRWNTRNAIASLSREWGGYVSMGYRGNRPATSGLAGAAVTVPGDAVFSTSELYWRPSQFANSSSEIFEVYGRASNTLHDGGSVTRSQALRNPCSDDSDLQIDGQRNRGSVSGIGSTVGSLGVRYTPSTDVGLTFGLERQFNLGSATRRGTLTPLSREAQCNLNLAGDTASYKTRAGGGGWLGYVTYGFYDGTGLRQDVPSWRTIDGYAQLGYAKQDQSATFTRTNMASGDVVAEDKGRLKRDQAFAALELRAGQSFRMDAISDRLVLFPHVVLGADWLWQKNRISSSIVQDKRLTGVGSSWALGVGPGVNMRYWFREDHYNAPRSYLDWTVQYRFSVGGGAADRARGLFMNLTLSY